MFKDRKKVFMKVPVGDCDTEPLVFEKWSFRPKDTGKILGQGTEFSSWLICFVSLSK